MKSTPPALAEWLLVRMFRHDHEVRSLRLDVHEAMAHAIAGDMAEVFNQRVDESGETRARLWYWGQVLRAVPSFARFQLHILWTMGRSYLRSAMRHFGHTRWYTAVNVAGLAIGLTVSIMAFLYVRHETGFDRFHGSADRLYRVGLTAVFEDLTIFETTPAALAGELETTVSGIERAVGYAVLTDMMLREDERVEAVDIHALPPDFFEMFDFSIARGRTAEALEERGVVLISQAEATRRFPGRAAVGRTLDIELTPDDWRSFEIVGVIAPPPGPTNLAFDYVISDRHLVDVFGSDYFESWNFKARNVTLVQLAAGLYPEDLVSEMNSVAKRYELDQYSEGANPDVYLPMERLTDAHLSEGFSNRFLAPGGDASQVRLLVFIALLMLIVACVNYVNLTVGLSLRRAREVGVRKVFGAGRSQIARQHLFENQALVLISLAVAIVAVRLLVPVFNDWAGVELAASSLMRPGSIAFLAAFVIAVGAISGGYPALVLSSIRPVGVFRAVRQSLGRRRTSRVMIAFQFMVSMTLIASTAVVFEQLDHLGSRPLGFSPEHVVVQVIPRLTTPEVVDRYRNALAGSPRILGVSGARTTLLGDGFDSALRVERGGEEYTLAAGKIDDRFLDVMGLDLVGGRNLDQPGDLNSNTRVLVNESFVSGFGIEDPVGAETPFALSREGPATIVGVVADFHFQSLRREIEPILLYARPESNVRQILTRIDGRSVSETLAEMEAAWKDVSPHSEFDARFLDDHIEDQYRSEHRLGRISLFASLLTVLLAVTGLVGMTALSISRRLREIGIRKVLGADSARLIALFNAEYALVALISSACSVALTWVAMNRWLQTFAFRIEIDPGVLVGSCLAVILLAALVISILGFKASQRRPVTVLKHV